MNQDLIRCLDALQAISLFKKRKEVGGEFERENEPA